VKKNGGRVYPDGPEVSLLIDLKGDWRTSYPVLREILKGYADVLTTFQSSKKESRAILVVISGSRSREMFADEDIRYACLDGELSDLDSDEPRISSPGSA